MSEEKSKEEKALEVKAQKDAAKIATKKAKAVELKKIKDAKQKELAADRDALLVAAEVKAKQKKDGRLARPGVIVELIKGDQWVDDLSGISLFRGFYNLVGNDEIEYADVKDRDKIQQSGYVKLDKERQSYMTLPDLDDEQLVRVEKALRLGILKIYDDKKPTKYVDFSKTSRSKVSYDKKSTSGFKYNDSEDADIANFLALPFKKFSEEVVKIKSSKVLEKIYDAEYAGTNAEARARKLYVDILKKQIKDKAEGVGNISSSFVEKVNIG